MTSHPALDPVAIQHLRAVSPDDGGKFLRDLACIYFAEVPLRLAELEDAINSSDAPAGSRAAHSIKGSAGTFGAMQLAAVAQQIEQLCQEDRMPATGPLLVALKDEFALVLAELRLLTANDD